MFLDENLRAVLWVFWFLVSWWWPIKVGQLKNSRLSKIWIGGKTQVTDLADGNSKIAARRVCEMSDLLQNPDSLARIKKQPRCQQSHTWWETRCGNEWKCHYWYQQQQKQPKIVWILRCEKLGLGDNNNISLLVGPVIWNEDSFFAQALQRKCFMANV